MYSLSLLRYLSRRCEVLQEVVHQQYFKMTRFTPESLILSNLQFCRPLVWGYTSLFRVLFQQTIKQTNKITS